MEFDSEFVKQSDITHYPQKLRHCCTSAWQLKWFIKVWYDIQLHFGQRGKEGNRHLQPGLFALKRDKDAIKYFTITFNKETTPPPQNTKHWKGTRKIRGKLCLIGLVIPCIESPPWRNTLPKSFSTRKCSTAAQTNDWCQ